MVTTRRSTEETAFTNEHGSLGGISVLERPATYEEFIAEKPAIEENLESEKALRRKNLEKLLNYDRYSAEVKEVEEVEAEITTEPVVCALSDEDIRPTSTTMQFGEDIDQIRHEMNMREEVKPSLNNRGKLAVTLYSLVVTVILALIVLNTGVLAKLSNITEAKTAELNTSIERYNAIQSEIESISNSEYIMDIAQNQFGMVR